MREVLRVKYRLNMNRVRKVYERDGYVIVQSARLRQRVSELKYDFESKFEPRFGNDVQSNRNLMKRFADSLELSALFASRELSDFLKKLGIESPVFCGPIVSHYTHTDLTGNSYGLPWHQDYPSMASSSRALIAWMSVNDCSAKTHSIQVIPGGHRRGLLAGEQSDRGYILAEQCFAESKVLEINAGDVLLFSPYLPHRTYVNPASATPKLSFSRRFDDLECPNWKARKFANAYANTVDRELYLIEV